MAFPMPRNLAEQTERRGRTDWIADLPATVNVLKSRWTLRIDEPFQPGGQTAWVAPARSGTFGDVVLKVARNHDEALDEAKGLREWDGDGAVRLLADEDIDETTTALLLERCRPGTALSGQPDDQQDRVVAGLLRRVWKTPPFRETFRPLQQMCDQWAHECEQKIATRPSIADPGLLREGVAAFRALPASAERQVLLCTDLHAGNVLAAEREPWLVIDPKPYIGDPTYDALQHLLYCENRLMANPRALIERMSRLLDLDAERLALWLFARCVIESPDSPELLAVARRVTPA